MSRPQITKAMRSALLWLRRRNGDGGFDTNGVLVAAGEKAPVMRATWNHLVGAGLVREYQGRKRLGVTEAGSRFDLTGVTESGDEC
jgi:hypothetical protein